MTNEHGSLDDNARTAPSKNPGESALPNQMSIDVLSFSLQALQQRTQVLAANIANANTPGYQAERVSFQRSLDAALQQGGRVAATLQPEGLPSRASGNNVNLATEFSELERNDLETQSVSDALTSSFSVLKTAIVG